MKHHKVFIADDHAIVRQGIKMMLQGSDTLRVVGETGNGSELLDQCLAFEPDILIMDICLQCQKDGLDLIKHIRKTIPPLHILVFSNYPEDPYAIRAIKAGAQGYLNKRQEPLDLLVALDTIASGKRYISTALAQELANWIHQDRDKPLQTLLSDREFQTMQFLAQGLSVSDIAIKLNLSVKTISMYRHRMLHKLGFKHNTELIAYAIRQGITSPH